MKESNIKNIQNIYFLQEYKKNYIENICKKYIMFINI